MDHKAEPAHFPTFPLSAFQRVSISACQHFSPFPLSPFLLITLAVLLAFTAPAATASNPYLHTITNRNVFALKEPPDPSKAPPPPPPNVPAVKLAGITTVMGGKRAILRVPHPARPPVPAGETSLILAEGAPAEDGIQVLAINIATATVRINNNGTTQDLDLEKDAPKSAPAAAPAIPVPGQPGAIPVPRPAVLPVPNGVANFARPIRGAGPPGVGEANAQGVPGAGPAGIGAPPPPQPLYRTVEEQEVLMELERDRTAAAVAAGELPPLPPTSLQQEFQNEQQAQPNVPPALPF